MYFLNLFLVEVYHNGVEDVNNFGQKFSKSLETSCSSWVQFDDLCVDVMVHYEQIIETSHLLEAQDFCVTIRDTLFIPRSDATASLRRLPVRISMGVSIVEALDRKKATRFADGVSK